jgi:hypothetical protein
MRPAMRSWPTRWGYASGRSPCAPLKMPVEAAWCCRRTGSRVCPRRPGHCGGATALAAGPVASCLFLVRSRRAFNEDSFMMTKNSDIAQMMRIIIATSRREDWIKVAYLTAEKAGRGALADNLPSCASTLW